VRETDAPNGFGPEHEQFREVVRDMPGFTRGRNLKKMGLKAQDTAELDIAQVFVDRCLAAMATAELTAVEAAKAKWWTTELQKRVVDACVQLHGGYGYMLEYPVAKAYLDARIQTIYGGTTEIMKEIIGRNLGV
jgi:alkylation response protein AidB-like acyl-CoA dehydrogenase